MTAAHRITSADGEPGQRIPVRYWLNPHAFVVGYLEVGERETCGDTEKYTITFRQSPLTEPPRYELRILPDGSTEVTE